MPVLSPQDSFLQVRQVGGVEWVGGCMYACAVSSRQFPTGETGGWGPVGRWVHAYGVSILTAVSYQ